MRHKLLMTAAVAALCGPTARPAAASTEGALCLLWQRHLAATNHAEMANAFAAFAEQPAHAALAPVATVLGSWHDLRAGRHDAAAARLEPLLAHDDGAASSGCAELARAWLTRLDAVRLRAALHAHYLKRVAFPVRLSKLESMAKDPVPLEDRWGREWTYRLIGFETLPGLRDQKYMLRSPVLQDATSLSAALERPYRADIMYKPLRLVSPVPGHETWEFRTGDGKKDRVFLSVGATSGKARFLYSGDAILILADTNYCTIMLRPNVTKP